MYRTYLLLSATSIFAGFYLIPSLERGTGEDYLFYLILPSVVALVSSSALDRLRESVSGGGAFSLFRSTYGARVGTAVSSILALCLVLIGGFAAEGIMAVWSVAFSDWTAVSSSGPALGAALFTWLGDSLSWYSAPILVLAFAPLFLFGVSIRLERPFMPTGRASGLRYWIYRNTVFAACLGVVLVFIMTLMTLSAFGVALSPESTVAAGLETLYYRTPSILWGASEIIILVVFLGLLGFSLLVVKNTLVEVFYDASITKRSADRLAAVLSAGLTAIATIWIDHSMGSGLIPARIFAALLLLMIVSILGAALIRSASHVDRVAGKEEAFAAFAVQIGTVLICLFLLWELDSWIVIPVVIFIGITGILSKILGIQYQFRGGAVYHLFARWGDGQYDGLDRELRGILREKGLRDDDPFEEVVAQSTVIDAGEDDSFEFVVERVGGILSEHLSIEAAEIAKMFLDGTRLGATPVAHGIALPHLRIAGLVRPLLVIVRSRSGVMIETRDPLVDHPEHHQVHAVFFLVSNDDDPAQHLRILAEIAERVEEADFHRNWEVARGEDAIRELLQSDRNYMTLVLQAHTRTADLIGKTVRELGLPSGTLVAVIRRNGSMQIPTGDTRLQPDDRLTIIGAVHSLDAVRDDYFSENIDDYSGRRDAGA